MCMYFCYIGLQFVAVRIPGRHMAEKKKEKRSNINYNNRLGANLVKYLSIRLPHVSHGLKASKQIQSCLVPFMPLSADWTKFLKW